jgi:phosphoribosylformylglycinamidine synthase
LNEMWPCGPDGERLRMNMGVSAIADALMRLASRIIGGKDSTSFYTKTEIEGIIKSLETLLLSLFVPVKDVRNVYTPFIKKPGDSYLGFLDLSKGDRNLSGSFFAQSLGQVGDKISPVDFELLSKGAEFILRLKKEGLVLSCHDTKSDGVFVAALEMALAGCSGLQFLDFSPQATFNSFNEWFSEPCGMLMEYQGEYYERICELATEYGVQFSMVAMTLEQQVFSCKNDGINYHIPMKELALMYDEISYQVSLEQTTPECAMEMHEAVANRIISPYHVPFEVKIPVFFSKKRKPKAAVIWDQGSNGITEMAAWLMDSGYDVFDAPIAKIRSGKVSLAKANGLFPVGGFSYGDRGGSAVLWGANIFFNSRLDDEFSSALKRKDIVGGGFCNGCQLFRILDLRYNFMTPEIPTHLKPRLIHNRSGKFDALEVRIKILDRKWKIWLKDMGGAVLSIPTAHGEGNYFFKDGVWEAYFEKNNFRQSPMYYAGQNGLPALNYPDNPSGSAHSVPGLLSPDERFIEIMPHPERVLCKDNLSWKEGYPADLIHSPWKKLPENSLRYLYRYM